MTEPEIELIKDLTNLSISLVALIIAIVALYYTVRSFLLKSGHNIRCNFIISNSIECNDKYISSMILENMKDRAAVIFSIHMKIGPNNYLLIEEFEKSPLIIHPFEVIKREYNPLLFYAASLTPVKLDSILHKGIVILSTTDGKYEIKSSTKQWSPVPLFFQNYATAIIHPIRTSYNGKSYGSNVKYIIDLAIQGMDNLIIPVYPNDYQIKKFNKFRLTVESLESAETLKAFLHYQKSIDNLKFDEIKIIPFQEHIQKIKLDYSSQNKELTELGYLSYTIIGRYWTKLERQWSARQNYIRNRKQ